MFSVPLYSEVLYENCVDALSDINTQTQLLDALDNAQQLGLGLNLLGEAISGDNPYRTPILCNGIQIVFSIYPIEKENDHESYIRLTPIPPDKIKAYIQNKHYSFSFMNSFTPAMIAECVYENKKKAKERVQNKKPTKQEMQYLPECISVP
jgi:hypothetical protein